MATASVICVPIDASLYNELVLRVGDPARDVSAIIEDVLVDYLQRTEEDGDLWSPTYFEWREHQVPEKEFRKEYGEPDSGYFWTPLFLPNGTKLSMTYGGKKYSAEIRHEQIYFDGNVVSSPSALASVIAHGTSRNAWLALMIKRPKDPAFRLADDLRREGARK